MFEPKIVNIFLSISLKKNRGGGGGDTKTKKISLIETVLLSTHSICLVEK